jgi:hypothetical protein
LGHALTLTTHEALRKALTCRAFREAGEGTRTLDLRLGKPTLYQLSYAREAHTLAGCEGLRY